MRAAAAWLSPSALLFVVLAILAWRYVPPVATRGIAALDGVNGALDTLNRPSTGLLARIDAALANVNAASQAWSDSSRQQAAGVNAILRDTRATLWQVNHAVAAVGILSGSLTEAAQSAGVALVATGRVVDGVVPLETQLGATARQYEQVGAAAVPVLKNAQVASKQAAIMATDGRKVADHLEADLDRPKSWWEKALPAIVMWGERGVRALKNVF
ncbi:hypothetical protein ACOBR2_06470 [Telmatobacter bradus]|uniref:hypothetical protein n=1 Tax=Telmatobacter bradus TaxID=474953 RepID=UPI003B432F75